MSLGQLMQTQVRSLLDELGYDLTFRRITRSGGYDPATGQTGTPSNDDETVRGYFTDYRVSEVDGTQIQRGDRKAIISAVTATGAALTKTPQTDDVLIGQGNEVRIVAVREMRPDDKAAVYVCQVRS